jgi:hypothetical protein
MRNVDVRRCVTALLAILISVTATPANAKCKFNVDTAHSITGEKVLWTKWETFSFGSSMGAKIAGTIASISDAVVGSGVSYGDKKFFALRVTRPASMVKMEMDSALVIPENGKLLISMNDNSILELHSEEKVIGDVVAGVAEAVIKFPLDSDAMHSLLTKRILTIGLQTSKQDLEYSFGKKGAKKMQATLKCIQ